jgi:hypothetical protein
VSTNFLRNIKAENYKEFIEDMLPLYHKLGYNMSLKVHMLHSELDFFPNNCSIISDDNTEQFSSGNYDGKMVSGKVVQFHVGRLLLDPHQKCS